MIYPFNHILMYYEYHAEQPAVLQLLIRIFNILGRSEPDMSSVLEDTTQNRFVMMKRIEVDRTLRNIKLFLENVFKEDKLEKEKEEPSKRGEPEQEQMLYYCLAKIYEDLGNTMTSIQYTGS
jgi:hypothetical protein